jgi:hypothetical protein
VTARTPAADATPADWVVAGLRGFAESVHSVVPFGFPAYLRVFHPAYRGDWDHPTPVRWAEIAALNGTRAHPGMQLDVLTGEPDHRSNEPQPGVFDFRPRDGTLPPELVGPLARALASHTTTPERCWFAVWEGWGDIRSDVARAPKFEVPNRAYHLLSGPLDAVLESVTNYEGQSASLWWPDDHAWCVATEIDFNTTYIGCDDACSEAIRALPELEALPTDPAGRGYEEW